MSSLPWIDVSGERILAKHYQKVINDSLARSGWTIEICQSVASRDNVSEYVVKVEEHHNNVIYLISVFLFHPNTKDARVVFCQRNNGVARVLRKRRYYANSKIIPFHRSGRK